MGQESSEKQQIALEAQDAVREEIQRYFGYEDLAYRYITIPYDMTMQINQQGRFVDIGYALFALLPISLLIFTFRKKRLFYTVLICSLLYLFTCYRFSFIRDNMLNSYNPTSDDLSQSVAGNKGWTQEILEVLYTLGAYITEPIVFIVDHFTEAQDYTTYPIIIGLLMFALIMVLRKKVTLINGFLWILGSIYFFLWWILSGGIIWYGLLMIPLGYVLLAKTSRSVMSERIRMLRSVLFIVVLGSYALLAYTARISNISGYQKDHPDNGKLITDHRIYPYMIGQADRRMSLQQLSANLPMALDKINSDDKLIFQFGASLNYEIHQNHKRIFEDNTISYFYALTKKYPSRSGLTDYFKSVGVKYLVVDLRLPTLDRTPEKSLTEKYKILMFGYLRDNDDVALVGTDQVINLKQVDGTSRQFSGVFGDEIVTLGSYAVFEIK